MVDPTLTGAGIGGAIIATFWGVTKLVPVIAKVVRTNGPGKNTTLKSLECKPGKADVCIERGEKFAKHDQILINLVNETEESKADRQEIKSDVKKILYKVGG